MAGVFKEAVLTQKGVALLAKVQASGAKIELTKAVSGDGGYSISEDLTARTSLKSQRQEFKLAAVKRQNETNVFIKFLITNKQESGNLVNGYYIKEVGIYAKDPDEGEILYAIAIANENQWDYLPAYNDLLPSTITVNFLIEVSNADTVVIKMDAPLQVSTVVLTDDSTGAKYKLGISDGAFYYEEVEE
nr:MAG TPA: tail collar fiber protein [Caudoviricetes sp.]